ncbi:forkhead-associated domain-containing protein 1 isoform X3 [Oxyura jamaicensis]|uniref:forkhead-associated domain-containing protein 1 isoform X3 n=1 Tax=Oxyura jamaicensis TaxID=8884 RepID=UPI0015A594BB|nr:forkhead-associated domain-containing protein 1 isoform X3 [Oxyura jamaicensis]
MRAFLRSSDECFQLKPQTTTIGRHEGSDIVLKASYPPVKRRTAWAGQLQVAADPQRCPAVSPAHLPLLQSQHRPGTWGSWAPAAASPVPHPPLQKRPLSAWTRSATASSPPDAFSRPPAERPAWTTISGNDPNNGAGAPFLRIHSVDCLLQEKDEMLLRLEKEISRLSGFEAESKQKDTVIRSLQDKIAAMAKTMAQAAARSDVELTQKLLTLDREIRAKAEEIKTLKEQISDLQKDSSEVFSHSLYERDLEIGSLRKESEKLKRDHALTTGLVTSLQREIAVKEQKIQQLRQDVEKIKKANREKDNQLAVVSAKCSRLKEEMKRDLGEKDVTPYQKRIGELERDLKGLQEEVQKYRIEQETIQTKLSEKAKAEEELKNACERKSVQLQEMGRRERLLKSDVDRAKVQLASFKTQVVQACLPQAAEEAGKALTIQQVLEKVRQICEENQQSQEREKRLQEEISARLSKEKEVSENVEVFKESVRELQAFLGTSFCSDSLRRELCKFEAMLVDPLVSDVQAAVVKITHVALSWLEGAEQLLASAGLDLLTSGKGLTACLRRLLENNQETMQRNEMLQAQLKEIRESQDALLQERLKEQKVKYEQDLQIKIHQIALEKEEEKKEIMKSTAAKEKDKHEKYVEEEKKIVQDLESRLRSMTEVMEMKSKEQEVADLKLREAVRNLEETTAREMMLKQQVLRQDEQLKIIQEESEVLKQKVQEEIAGYKEQIKQHARTIVALEDSLLEAEQQQKTLEKENITLLEKIEGLQGDACRETAGASQEASCTEESHRCVLEELAAAQSMLLAKEAAIARLTKELSETQARMSDMRGELSEKQKAELEWSLVQMKSQERDLKALREKLSEMSKLVAKKDQELKAAAAELRQAQEDCKALQAASREMAQEPETLLQTQARVTPATVEEASETEPALDLVELGAKCRGLRHEETIQRQKEGLVELRERIKLLEKMQSSTVMSKAAEPLVVQKRDLSGKRAQKAGLEKEAAPLSGAKTKCSKCLGCFPDGCSHVTAHETASSEVLEALDLRERMYLDLICALGSLMNMEELAGMQSVQHLPQEEREKEGQQRRKDFELLYEKISKLKSRLEKKEELLKDYEARIEQLRLNQESLQMCQEEMLKLEDEVHREAEEKALLREALERAQVQLGQEKRLNRVVKQRKTAQAARAVRSKVIDGFMQSFEEEKEKRKEKVPRGCARPSRGRGGKPGPQPSMPAKLKMKECPAEPSEATGST